MWLRLIFEKDAYIFIKNGNIVIQWNEDGRVKLTGKDKSKGWRGIYVKGNNYSKSEIKFTTIEDLNFFKGSGYFLTGGLNFYKSDLINLVTLFALHIIL